MSYENIPSELRVLAQWVTWRYEDQGGVKPTKVPYNPTNGRKADHSDPFTWTSYDNAVRAANQGHYDGIGYVLAEHDPYCFIDLDDVHEDAEAMERQLRIFEAFQSYAEISPSKKGLHIIVKAAVPAGRKRSFVEIYSKQRFMTMTGDVYRAAPITAYQDAVMSLWGEMGPHAVLSTYQGAINQSDEDEIVFNRACAADNGEKFKRLWYGKYQDDYSSQSEADFALINIIAFYTKYKPQIARMFRFSALGQRPKAFRNTYVDYMIARSFDRDLQPVDLDGIKNQIALALAARRLAAPPNPFATSAPLHEGHQQAVPYLDPNNTVHLLYDGVKPQHRKLPETKFEYEKPPGLVGDIANFIYAAAPRQVPEMALVGALALMSGITGRAYNVSGMGLNQYILLLAPTGTGKEAIASGIDKLMTEVQRTVPAASEFIGPAEIASPEALLKYMSNTSASFMSMIGEFGLKLKQMASISATPSQAGLKRIMLDLFNKSGEGHYLRPMIYSDRSKNTDIVEAPAFSLMGESVPEKFYELLNEGMISDGLLPRFTIVEYRGVRHGLNKDHGSVKPSPHLIEQLATLSAHALMLNKANKAVHVRLDEIAQKMFDDFDKFCDDRINNSPKEIIKQLWNRSHVKALKLAALVSVGTNPYAPTITDMSASWAIKLVVHDAMNLLERFENGTIGASETSDLKQIDDLSDAIGEYLTGTAEIATKYHVPIALHTAHVVPYSYLSRRLASSTSFRNDRIGSTGALKKCIQALIDRGDLQEVNASDRANKFKTTARCFVVSNVKSFIK